MFTGKFFYFSPSRRIPFCFSVLKFLDPEKDLKGIYRSGLVKMKDRIWDGSRRVDESTNTGTPEFSITGLENRLMPKEEVVSVKPPT